MFVVDYDLQYTYGKLMVYIAYCKNSMTHDYCPLIFPCLNCLTFLTNDFRDSSFEMTADSLDYRHCKAHLPS